MSYYDPHTGHQIRALRTDPTGRYNPIELSAPPANPFWFAVMGTLAFFGALAIAVMVLS